MQQKLKELQELFEPFIDKLLASLPGNVSKDMTVMKLQEAVWWAEKSHRDEAMKHEAGSAVNAKKD